MRIPSIFKASSKKPRPIRLIIPVGVLLLLLTTAVLTVVLSYRFELQTRQRSVIADALWVEQAIQFQLTRNREAMETLAQEIAHTKITPRDFEKKAAVLLRNHPEFIALHWVDAQHKTLATRARENMDPVELKPLARPAALEALERAARLEQPSYSRVYVNPTARRAQFDLTIPVLKQQKFAGALIVNYALTSILDEHVPWWFAQEYEVSLGEPDTPPAIRRSSGKGKEMFTHQIQIELAGLTLRLKINSIHGEPQLIPNILTGTVVVLCLILLFSLWALWRDISQRITLDQQLAEQSAFRKAMEDSLVTGLRARDLEGRVTYVNPAFCEMTGYRAEEMIGQTPPMPYWAPEAIEDYQRRHEEVLAGTVSREGYEAVFKRKNGERFEVLIFEAPLIDANGRQTGWMSSILDITQQKKVELLNHQQQEKLQSAARLTTMGELASMLSHELNQPLSAISSYSTASLNLLQGGKFSAEDALGLLGKINQQALRAGQVIRSVQEFVRKRPPTRARLALETLIHNVQPLVELQAAQHDVRVVYEVTPALPDIYVDAVMMEQVLLNLTRNGIEAMQDTPLAERVLTIRVQPTATNGAGAAEVGPTLLEVAVADRGSGMSPEVEGQIFTSFFSTKTEGMGMGLNICRTAVEFHGGRLEFVPNPGGGTIFRFTLPIYSYSVHPTAGAP